MTAIEVEDVWFRYPGAADDTLRGVDLRIERGDFVAIVGGNGSGKTTLCKTFNGLVPHFWSGDLVGAVRVLGEDTRDLTVAALSHKIGYVYQDFASQLVRPTVRDEVAFAPVNFGLDDWAERADGALEALDVTALADRFTWQLSGGQQHLVALASVMALRPEIIVVDEPVAELDPARATEIYERLAQLNRQGTTVVVIEHHAEFVARYAKSVVLMADGAPRWHLPVADALARTDDLDDAGIPAPQVVAVARALDPDGPVPIRVDETARWLAERSFRPRAVPDGGTPAGRVAPAGHGSADHGPADHRPAEAPIAARLTDVVHGYRSVSGEWTAVLDGLDLTLREGERIALVGSNGAGKSTLLRLLTGLKVPRSGDVVVGETNTRTVSAAQLADQVCYLYQRPEQMFIKDSVRADVGCFPAGRGRPGAAELVEGVLETVRLGELADRDGRLLSGGQQRRATLAIGLAMRPALLLLDEPTSSLDVRSRDDVITMLARLAEHIRCVVVATHDMHLVAEWADRVIVLDAGCVVADTDPASLFSRPELLTRARLVPPQVAQLGAAIGMDPPPLSVPELLGRLAAEVAA